MDWWARQDLNLGPTDYESAALTAELRAPCCYNVNKVEHLIQFLTSRQNFDYSLVLVVVLELFAVLPSDACVTTPATSFSTASNWCFGAKWLYLTV